MVVLQRIYDKEQNTSGFRVLVDRLWPRGISMEKARLDLWMKDIGPSNELRKWFGHDPKKWDGFVSKYKEELKANPGPLTTLQKIVKDHKNTILLYGARDTKHNEAAVLLELMQ